MEKRNERERDMKDKKENEWRDGRTTKRWTIENDKWGRKEYIKESNSGAIKDKIKIRLHMWGLKDSYWRKGLANRCPMCQHSLPKVFLVGQGLNQRRTLHNKSWNITKETLKLTLNDQRGKEWGEILGIYRKNKKNRPTDNIGEEQSVLEE